MKPFDRRLRVKSQTMVWQRNQDGFWERHLIRQLTNGSVYWSPLHQVLADVPCCLACLSHRVSIEKDDEYGTLRCHDCGVRYGFV